MSKSLPVVSYQQLCAALSKAGFNEIPGRGKGSHVFLFRTDPPTGITVSRQREIKRGTLRAIIRQAGLTVDEFVDLL